MYFRYLHLRDLQRLRVGYVAMAFDPLSVEHALRTTRSVRRRLDFERPVEREVIEACIDSATQAPTGRHREDWRFLVVTAEEKKAALAGLYRRALAHYREILEAQALETGEAAPPVSPTQQTLADRMHEIPVLILACMLGEPEAGNNARLVAFYGSILPAAWSLMVALRARGLGSTWTTLHLLYEAEAAEILGIPEGVTQTVLLPVGYTKDAVLRPADRLPAEAVTFWNTWGERPVDGV